MTQVLDVPGRWRRLQCLLLFRYLLLLLPVSSTLPVAHADDTRPDLYVLAVGVGQFQDSRLPPLQYADDDAKAIAQALQQQQGRLYGAVQTRLLLEGEATRANLIQALLEVSQKAGPKDQVVVFLGGHGAIEQATGRWHYFTQDTNPANIPGTALEQDALLSYLQLKGRAKRRTLLMVDTCQAGALSGALRMVSGGDGRDYLAGEIERLDEQSAAERRDLLSILSAGTSTDRAVEGPQHRLPIEPPDIEGHGIFTRSVLEALTSDKADRDGNGVVTLSEFQRHVSSTTRTLSGGKQQPDPSGDMGDIRLFAVPGAKELCDGLDNNLDGTIDEGFPDADKNGRADCLQQEQCNGRDDNGDGRIDEGFDLDGDGYASRELCGFVHGTDCNDRAVSVHPDQKDWGNLRDDDCDGTTDEDDADRDQNCIPDGMERRSTWFRTSRTLTGGAAVVLAAGSALAYSQLFALRPPISDTSLDPADYQVTDADRESYRTWSTVTAGAGLSSLTLTGLSLTFTWQDLALRKAYFPTPCKSKGKGQREEALR